MPSGNPADAGQCGSAGFALPILLLALAVGGIAVMTAEIPLSYRLTREREEELHFRGRAYVDAIRSFYMAEEQPLRRRLPTRFEELERDPRFPQKRHIRRIYSDPLAKKPDSPFRGITDSPGLGQPQGLIGVASTSDTPLLRRAGFETSAGPTLGIKTAADLIFQVDLKLLSAPPQPVPGTRPVKLPNQNHQPRLPAEP